MVATDKPLILTRTFRAPRSLMFKVWTDPKHLAQWWGPHHFTNPRCELDVRPGGKILVHMQGPDGNVYPMTGVYHEVVEPERLVFVSAVPDEKGNSIFEILNTVTFTEQSGVTTLRIEAQVIQKTAHAEQFLKGMEMGWTQSLEKLAAHVAAA